MSNVSNSNSSSSNATRSSSSIFLVNRVKLKYGDIRVRFDLITSLVACEISNRDNHPTVKFTLKLDLLLFYLFPKFQIQTSLFLTE